MARQLNEFERKSFAEFNKQLFDGICDEVKNELKEKWAKESCLTEK